MGQLSCKKVSHLSCKVTNDQKELAQRLIEEGKSVRQVAQTFDVHVATSYRLQPQ
jgi:transposase